VPTASRDPRLAQALAGFIATASRPLLAAKGLELP
jgi:hypothetical protein